MGKRFSFASVILSYFLVAGGLLVGLLLAAVTKISSEYVGYILFAIGSFLGGFLAARASRGSTIIEPALGAVLVVATLAATIALTPVGALFWHTNPDAVTKAIVAISGATLVGSLLGAFLSEKILGEATTSSVPWILYAAVATFGAAALATFVSMILALRGEIEGDVLAKVATLMVVGTGIGCLLSGICVGASARVAPRVAAFVGGGLGVTAFFLLSFKNGSSAHDKNAITGFVVLAIGGAIVTLIGSAIGWAAVGKNNADA